MTLQGAIPVAMRVAIQGELGSFSHEALIQSLPNAAVLPCSVSADVFRALSNGIADAALIPIENSLAGSVVEHFDYLLNGDMRIEWEMALPIHHFLIAHPGASIESIGKVASHPIALAQCRGFFEKHPQLMAIPHYDTAGSVKDLLSGDDRRTAAIAGEQAVRQYGGSILAARIEDNPHNYTRFLFLRRAKDAAFSHPANKVSLAFALEHRPGALVEALRVFSDAHINLLKIESRPVPGKPWQYVFFIDASFSNAGQLDGCLAALRELCPMVKELGRYSVREFPTVQTSQIGTS